MLIKTDVSQSLPVSLDEAVDVLRATDDDRDALDRYLASAVEFVEYRTGRTLRRTEFELHRDGWARCIKIAAKPVREVSAIRYFDENDAEQEVDEADFAWFHTYDGAEIQFKNGFSFPSLSTEIERPVRVDFIAGYGAENETGVDADDPELELPNQAAHAILLLAGHFLENREALTEKPSKAVELGAEALIANLRIYR